MKRLALAFSMLSLASPVMASECDALVAQIVRETGVDFVKFPSEHEATLKDGGIKIDIGCRARTANFETPTAFPSARFFDLVGLIGSTLTGASSASINATAKTCQMRAMKGGGSAAEETQKAYVDCLFKRGLQAYVLVLPRR